MKKGHKYGTHRVISPKGVLPQPADKLDNNMDEIYDNEILIDVQTLNIDSASFTQISNQAGGDKAKIAEIMLDIVEKQGKHRNPVTGSGGMLLGTVEKIGKIDILINNAGITNDSTLKKMTVEQWQNVIDVNLSGTFYCCKAVLNYMLEAGYGRIVNASSVVGLYGNFGQTNYVATKAGLIGMTKTMARELGRKGITVNAVAPGFIETEMVAKMPENVLDGMRAKVPVGRLGRPEEIAAAYLYLASDEAAYVNGAVLSVDGGMTV